MLTDYPPDAIDNITLATTIGPDDAGDTFIKIDDGLISKTFKPFDFQTLKTHSIKFRR